MCPRTSQFVGPLVLNRYYVKSSPECQFQLFAGGRQCKLVQQLNKHEHPWWRHGVVSHICALHVGTQLWVTTSIRVRAFKSRFHRGALWWRV